MDKERSAYVLRTTVSVLSGLVRVAASLAFVWVSKLLVDIATGVEDGELTRAAIFMGVLILIKILGGTFESWWEKRNVVMTGITVQNKTFGRLLGSVWDWNDAMKSGDVGSRLQEDVRVTTEMLCSRIPSIIVTICQLIAVSIYMVHISTKLLVVLLAIMAVFVLCAKLFYKVLRRLSSEVRESEAAALQLMQENALKRILVKTLFGTDGTMNRLADIQNRVRTVTMKRADYSALARVFIATGFLGGYGVAFLWGVFGIQAGAVTYGMMTAILQLVNQIQRPVVDMAGHIPALIRTMASVERLKEIWTLPQENEKEQHIIPEAPSVIFDSVSFGYASPVLKDFSFTFPAGKMTVVMGPTGRGKTTLIRLMLALVKPSSGAVRLKCGEGEPAEVSPATRCNFMYVPQGNSLVSGTIRENMLFVNPEADDEAIRQVLHTAVADFVFDLKDGLDTLCGEEGSGLSEGQCQRIAIARALLHNGTVLILDESTSALDAETEEVLLSRLMKSCHGSRTTIFISHREKVCEVADCVLRITQ